MDIVSTDAETAGCEEMIYSDDYGDYIIETFSSPEMVMESYGADCVQVINNRSVVLYKRIPGEPEGFWNQFGYSTMPKCYGLMDTSSMEASGVLALRQPYLNLYGSGVLVGIADTGIDYTHPAFIDGDNTSRIYSMWDQTIRDGPAPEGFQYGTEYRQDKINEALRQKNPRTVIPMTDVSGHGTFLAGITAGNEMPEEDFTGIAPRAELVIVKLKEAKGSLKRYYGIGADREAYQENDIMLGVRYLQRIAAERNMPIVILVGLGSNAGNHSGELPLSRFLERGAVFPGTAIVTAGGNEGGRGHHYQKKLLAAGNQDIVEINAAEGESGFTVELWARAPQLFAVEIRTPLGNSTGLLPVWYGRGTVPITFPLENSRIFVEYTAVEAYTGDEVVVMRILTPTPGLWRIEVVNEVEYPSGFHMWLPVESFLKAETRFLSPEPEITLCEPGNAGSLLTSTAYDHVGGGIYLHASRGFTSTGDIKPDLAAPGVNVYGPLPGGRFSRKSGTSIGAAHCAGAAVLLLEWGVVLGNNRSLQTTGITNILIRGADRENEEYPNRVWGYGKLNVYESFRELRPV